MRSDQCDIFTISANKGQSQLKTKTSATLPRERFVPGLKDESGQISVISVQFKYIISKKNATEMVSYLFLTNLIVDS